MTLEYPICVPVSQTEIAILGGITGGKSCSKVHILNTLSGNLTLEKNKIKMKQKKARKAQAFTFTCLGN